MTVGSTLRFIRNHPLTAHQPLRAIGRYIHWQMMSRLKTELTMPWIHGAKLRARRGMTGLSGNIYCGLHEFADMGFVLHLLQPGDLFLDVGANAGSYTILASAVCKARTVSVEPDPITLAALRANIAVNEISDLVEVIPAAVGSRCGTVHFTVGRDTTNSVLENPDGEISQVVALKTIDSIMDGRVPTAIKFDVEGFESQALAGAAATLQNEGVLAVEIETAEADGVAILKEAGFSPAIYDPWSRRLTRAANHDIADRVGRSSHNALYIRDFAACNERVRLAPVRSVLGHAL